MPKKKIKAYRYDKFEKRFKYRNHHGREEDMDNKIKGTDILSYYCPLRHPHAGPHKKIPKEGTLEKFEGE